MSDEELRLSDEEGPNQTQNTMDEDVHVKTTKWRELKRRRAAGEDVTLEQETEGKKAMRTTSRDRRRVLRRWEKDWWI